MPERMHHLLSSPPATYGAIFFAAFWIITLVTFVLARRTRVRRAYLSLFFLCLLVPGLLGRIYWLWPFQTWHLWGGLQPRTGIYHDLWLEDARGELHLYDRRAIPPMLNTQVQELGARCFDPARLNQRAPLGDFLLRQANAFRDRQLAAPTMHLMPVFPMRQFGRAWTRDKLRNTGAFRQLVARRYVYEFSSGGREVTVIPQGEFRWP